MEKLKAYLAKRHKGDFAREIGITQPYLSRLLGGDKQPSLSLMRKICAATNGKVDLNAWGSQ